MRIVPSAWEPATEDAVTFESARRHPAGLIGAVAVSLGMWGAILAFVRWLVR